MLDRFGAHDLRLPQRPSMHTVDMSGAALVRCISRISAQVAGMQRLKLDSSKVGPHENKCLVLHLTFQLRKALVMSHVKVSSAHLPSVPLVLSALASGLHSLHTGAKNSS